MQLVIRAFFCLTLCIFMQGQGAAESRPDEFKWTSVPLSTEKDIALGRKGGEGFQVVDSIVFAPSDSNIIYMSTNTSQVWKSIDGGRSWFSTRKGIQAIGVASIAIQPDNPEVVFAAGSYGANEQRINKFPNRLEGIYRSTNGGQTWSLIKKGKSIPGTKQRQSNCIFKTVQREHCEI